MRLTGDDLILLKIEGSKLFYFIFLLVEHRSIFKDDRKQMCRPTAFLLIEKV